MRTLILYLAVFFLSACATIMKDELEVIEIDTTPAGALVDAGVESCSTPCSLELPRKKSYELQISKNGYRARSYKVKGKSLDPWLWGNFVTIIPIGIAVDFYTGYAYDFDPKEITFRLEATSQNSSQ